MKFFYDGSWSWRTFGTSSSCACICVSWTPLIYCSLSLKLHELSIYWNQYNSNAFIFNFLVDQSIVCRVATNIIFSRFSLDSDPSLVSRFFCVKFVFTHFQYLGNWCVIFCESLWIDCFIFTILFTVIISHNRLLSLLLSYSIDFISLLSPNLTRIIECNFSALALTDTVTI